MVTQNSSQQAGLQSLWGGLAVAAGVGVAVGLLHADQEEWAGGEEGKGPEEAYDGLHLVLGDNHPGLVGEAEGEVALHGEAEDSAVGAALAEAVGERSSSAGSARG